MNLQIMGQGQPLTMSSREIADLCEKRHDHVMRDIKKMLDDLGEDAPRFGGVYAGGNGEERPCFSLPKDLTLTLVAGYNVVLRKRIIDRWLELEGQTRQAAIDVRDPAQLATIAIQLIEVNRELEGRARAAEARIEADKPKTAFFDQFCNADGLYGLQNAARVLGEKPNKFVAWLKQTYVFYQGGTLVPRAVYRDQGLFEVKATIIDDKAHYRTFITAKGLRYLAKKLDKPADLFGLT